MTGLMAGNGPVMQFTFGTMLPPVSREFGWSRGTVSSSIVIGLWMTGVATPLIGRLVDRFGVRRVALPAIAVFSVATASVALVPASRAAFTSLYVLMGLAAAGQTPLIYAKAISARFDAHRGFALGIAMAGVGLGAALVPQYAQALITHVGWRAAYAGLGALTFLLAFPAVAFVVGRQPGETYREKATEAPLPGLTAMEAVRTSRFWLLATSFFLVAVTTGGVISHLVLLLTDRGLSVQRATALLSISGLALIGGRVLAGFLLDCIHAPYVAAGFFTAPLAGIVALALTSHQDAAAISAVLIGMGLGAEVDLIAFLLSRYLGMCSFGEIYGYFFAIFMFGAGAGPLVMGVSFDRTGSYKPMLVCSAFLLVLASVLMLRLGAYAYPKRQTPRAEKVAQAACY
ncbi:MAG: MFS transporter [Bryobacteraceae bacterium]